MKKIIPLFSLLLSVSINLQGYSQIAVKNLKCEYLDNPIGIDETHPRFTWQMESQQSGNAQTAYELAVGTVESEVVSGKGNAWESGTVNSSVVPAVYKGAGLKHLLEKMGMTGDDLIAFGDGGNDIDMLKFAKYSYAMANGMDKVKKQAKYIAPANTENGVFKVLQKYLAEDKK